MSTVIYITKFRMTDVRSIPGELSPSQGKISTMDGRIKARSEGNEMDDDLFHKTCGAVGETSGGKHWWKVVLRSQTGSHVAWIPRAGPFGMPTVWRYLGGLTCCYLFVGLYISMKHGIDCLSSHHAFFCKADRCH